MSYSRTITAVRENARFQRLLGAAPRLVALGFVLALALIIEELLRRVLSSRLLDLIGVEPDSVFYTERLALTGHLYTDPHTAPFVVVAYGPLFPYAAWAVHMVLPLGTNVAGFYFAARLACGLSVVAMMIGVGATLVRFFGVEPLLAIVASLLIGIVIFPWGYVARPDSLYLAFLIWAVFAFHRFLTTPSVSRLLLSMALLLCAGYAKQTGFAFLPLLCLAGLFCLPTWKQRLLFLLGAVVIAALSVALAPTEFWQNSRVGLANGVDLRWAIHWAYWPLLKQQGIVLALWLPCLLLVLLGRRRRLFPIALLAIYALGVGTALATKVGSAINYYDEFLIFAIMLIAASLSAMAAAWIGQPIVALCFASALLCSYVIILLQTQILPPLLWQPGKLRINAPDLLAAQRYLSGRPGGLVADLADNGIGVFLPTRMAFATFEVTGTAATTGRLDLASVRQAIRSGTICYAVTQRAWATAVSEGKDERLPWYVSPWAGPVLHDLLPLFKQDAEFGDLLLMHNPVCATR